MAGVVGVIASKVLEVRPGDSWLRRARLERLDGFDLAAPQDTFVVTGAGAVTSRPGGAILRDIAMATALEDPRTLLHAADQDAWELLPEQAQQVAAARAGHLNEVRTGSKYGLLAPGDARDPRYDPAVGETQRMKHKAEELGVHLATLYRQREAYLARGLMGLVHGNFDPLRDPREAFTAAELDAAATFVEQNLTEARRDLNKLRPLFNVYLQDQGVIITVRGRRNALLALAAAGKAIQGSATTKNSQANRPKKGSWRRRGQLPGEVIQIDSTPLNVALWSPDEDGPDTIRCDVVAAVDVGPGRAHGRLAVGKATARDACLLIHDIMNPIPASDRVDDDQLWARWMGVPQALEVGANLAVDLGTVITDHGREFVNRMLIGLLASLGVTVLFAGVRDPTFKAFVESLMRSLAGAQQLMPGYFGNSVANRAKKMPPRSERLMHDETERALQNWMHLEYNETPLERHGVLNHPRRALSPNEVRRLDLAHGAPLRLPRTPDLVYAFLPRLLLTPASDGLHSQHVRYWAPVLDQLQHHQGDKDKPGQPIVVRYDPYDMSRVFWHEPETYRWHTLHALGVDSGALPGFSEALLPLLKAQAIRELPTENFKDVRSENFARYTRAIRDEGKSKRAELAADFLRLERAVPAVPWDPADAPPLAATGAKTKSEPLLHLIDEPGPRMGSPETGRYAIDDNYDLSAHFKERE